MQVIHFALIIIIYMLMVQLISVDFMIRAILAFIY